MTEHQSDSLHIDPALFADFLSESLEILDGLDALFVALEAHPDDTSVVDKIFRPVHSIKGNSSFFGLVNLKNFAHDMESVLQEIRSRKREATPPLISVLLKGIDMLRAMLERFRQGDMDTALRPEEEAYLQELAEVSAAGEDRVPLLAKAVRESMDSFASLSLSDEASSAFAALAEKMQALLKLVAPPAKGGAVEEASLFRIGSEMVTEPVREVMGYVADLSRAATDEQQTERFLHALGQLEQAARGSSQSSLAERIGEMRTDFVAIHGSGIGFDDLLAGLVKEKFDAVMNGIEVCDPKTRVCAVDGVKSGMLPEQKKPEAAAPPAPAKSEAVAAADAGGKTLRVAEEKVDSFMAYVGELIIASEVFAYIQKKLAAYPEVCDITQEFKNANLQFNELSTQLQKSLMEVRRIPVRTMTQKLPRIVRDTAAQIGKDVDLVVEGGDLQIDKSLVEGLESPIVHMVRNSVDHGLETPEERKAVGKPEKGHVWVSADADDETFRLTIRDDGRGLDVEALKAKAVEKGSLSREQADAMPDKEAFRLIFGAGVSTAKTVTDISGRGVGMDVVMSNISKLNGVVDVDAERGKGTTVTLTMPMTVTLLVVEGLVARVGGSEYIVPLADVRESTRPRAKDVQTVAGRGEMLDVRGELYRLLRLHELMGVTDATTDPAAGTVVLVEYEGRTCGLLVDELLGQQSVVLKDLGKHFRGLDILRGAAILGDGRVGLVLNTEGLLDAAFG